MTIVVGIIIVALVSWIVAAFGLAVFHYYERYIVPFWRGSGQSLQCLLQIDGPGSLSSLFCLFLSVLLVLILILPSSPLETRLQ